MTVADTFLLDSDTNERLALLHDSANEAELTRLLGQQGYRELRAVADRRFAGQHLAQKPKNMIFVPGIMGTLLKNDSRGGIWWIDVRTRDYIDQLGLAPDGRTDADGERNIEPVTADPSYIPFLSAAAAEPGVGHEIFAYDWRKSLDQSADDLRDRVLKLHRDNGGKEIHLVGHSLGGLMIRTALMIHGDEIWPRIGKIVFIGTPHYGSASIAGYLKNHLWGFELMALLGNYLSRETLRSLWGVINLLPAPRGVYPGTRPDDAHPWQSDTSDDPYIHPCANFDLYQADAWKLELDATAKANLQRVLDATADYYIRMLQAHRALDQEQRNRMVVIAGVGFKTLFRLAYAPGFLGLWEKTTKVFDIIEGDVHRQGDGRVPLASAELEHVGAIRYVRGVHGSLPNIPAVYQDVFRFLKGEKMQLPATPAGALSTHLGPSTASDAPHIDGSARAPAFSDDPGLWALDAPTVERMNSLEAMLKAWDLPDFSRLHLL